VLTQIIKVNDGREELHVVAARRSVPHRMNRACPDGEPLIVAEPGCRERIEG
jgi:hypothetical protein